MQAFFGRLPEIRSLYTESLSLPIANDICVEQLESIGSRLSVIGPAAGKRAVKLKFLEHKVKINRIRYPNGKLIEKYNLININIFHGVVLFGSVYCAG